MERINISHAPALQINAKTLSISRNNKIVNFHLDFVHMAESEKSEAKIEHVNTLTKKGEAKCGNEASHTSNTHPAPTHGMKAMSNMEIHSELDMMSKSYMRKPY